MRSRIRREGGFTLIELMITVAIIGVLAAIAVPNFIAYQARSRRSEAYANLASIARSYKGYAAENDTFPDMATLSGEPSLPSTLVYGTVGTHKMPWDAQTKLFFDIVGFEAEGSVFYTYDISANCGCPACFTATAHGDVDGDGGWGAVMYVHPQFDAAGTVVAECPSVVGALNAPLRDGVSVYDEVAVNNGNDDY